MTVSGFYANEIKASSFLGLIVNCHTFIYIVITTPGNYHTGGHPSPHFLAHYLG